MTIDATGQSANPWAVGMPEPLAATVFHYDKPTRRAIIATWTALGERGRRDYRDYLAATRLSWRRRERVRELIQRLVTAADLRPTSGTT